MKKLLAVALLVVSVLSCTESGGKREVWNDGWQFQKDGDTSWRNVTLPHDWGVESPFVRSNPGETGKLEWWGTARYRKTLNLSPKPFERYYLEFGGVMSNSTVFVNGAPAGGRPYGYSSFSVDISSFVHSGDNLIEVEVNNLPNSSRWYPGGGIYRPVYLRKTVAAPVPDIWIVGTDDVRVSFKEDVDESKLEITHEIPRIRESWSPDNPVLYTVKTTVRNRRTGRADVYYTGYGPRTAEFRPDGFYLNGEKTFLKGVCLHHDAGALGAVWNEEVWVRRLTQLKDMGCNAIRSAHNPPAAELLDLCDRMGFLVIDELTDTWTVPKKPAGYATLFDEWAEKDLVDMIHRDRNHPCVILWSIGNECGEQGYADKWDIPRRLSEICHREDPSRPTTAGNDNLWASSQPYHETIDVYGFNYKPHAYEEFHRANPSQPFYGSETASCLSTRGYYLFPVSDDKGKGWPDGAPYQVSSYDLYAPWWASSPDYEWFYEDQVPSCAGEFVWTGFDYIGEPTPYNFDPTVLTNFHDEAARLAAEKELEELSRNAPPSRSSYFGIIDLAGFPKDRYWLYKSRWRPDVPTAHILPHWNWPDRVGKVTPVFVYSSGDSAELFVNGKSQGVRTRGPLEYRFRWDDVVYEPGTVSVVCWKDGKEWARDTVRTSGAPAALEIETETGGDMVFVTVRIVDGNGLFVPDAVNMLSFKVSGSGELLATDAGDPTSHIAFKSPDLPAFAGLCSAVIRRTDEQGPLSVTVSSPGLVPASANL